MGACVGSSTSHAHGEVYVSTRLEKMLRLVRDREIGFGDFVAATRSDYRAMARYLLRRWATPEWLREEDVEQELYLETWRIVWKYDPARLGAGGKPVRLKSFVVFGAMAAAKRAMHRARGVSLNGSPDRKASRFETPLSQVGREEGDGESLMAQLLAELPRAEEELGAVEETRHAATEALAVCETKQERFAVLAIREAGSLDGAASLLYDDIDHRIDCRLGSEERAERFVRKHAGAVARRIEEARVNPG
jgi:DNA-directed RNA polymerase specialized sigma24 family protein